MRKFGLLVAALAMAGYAASAVAQESTYFFDARSSAAAITSPAFPYNVDEGPCGFTPLFSGGGAGDFQVIYISPKYPTNAVETVLGPVFPNEDGDADLSTASAYLYAQVNPNTDSPAGTMDVISSIGLDMSITDAGTSTDQVLSSASWSWAGDAGVVWSGTSDGTGGLAGINDARAVKVPVVAGPMYNTAGGLTPTSLHKVGALAFTAADRTSPCAGVGTYGVKLSVDSLLITRVFSSGGSATPSESVAFGYAGGTPELLSGGATGNDEGATTATDDATVVVQVKGDFDQDGILTSLDLGALLFLTNEGDCDGNGSNDVGRYSMYVYDADNDLTLTSLDLGVWLALSNDIGCPG